MVLFMSLAFWSLDISSFYCSDMNLLLIDYAWCKRCNKRLFLFDNNSRSLTLEENIFAVITQVRVIDGNLKKKSQNELCILVGYSY